MKSANPLRRNPSHPLWSAVTRLLPAATLLLLCGCRSAPPALPFSQWPAGASPAEIGRRVADNFAARKLDYETNSKRLYVVYPETCAWYGSLQVAKLTGDRDLQTRLIRKFDVLLTEDGARHISPAAHVDYRVFGIVPLEIYLETGDERCLALGTRLAGQQWSNPTVDGITSEARYWVDDMFMITALQVQAYRATGNTNYLERAALTLSTYLDRLQQTNGLFFHAPDVPFYWGRGNGWAAAAMAELLSCLPEQHPRRARILGAYRRMMETLLRCQGADGLWRQLLDHPEAWPETSSTGMFTFALITGVRHGWLDSPTAGSAARKGWLALVSSLNAQAELRDVCEGTGKKNSLEYYLARQRKTGDLHGQAPLLWCAAALLKE
jgi:unsaturated rhamnogalacturonyl hydrolase